MVVKIELLERLMPTSLGTAEGGSGKSAVREGGAAGVENPKAVGGVNHDALHADEVIGVADACLGG
jgi:hypothetical protein